MKFKLDQTVVAIKSGKSGVVDSIHISAKGTQYDVKNGANTTRAYRYMESDLVSESAHKKAQAAIRKLEVVKAKPVKAVAKAKPAKAKAAAKPAKKAPAVKKSAAKKPAVKG